MGRRKATVSEADPLLKAIIGKLPPAPTAWPAEQRKAWLEMMSMAFDVVYGPSDQQQQGDVSAVKSGYVTPPIPGAGPGHAGFDYYIDAQGMARDAIDDAPVTAAAVADEMIYDYRRGPARDRETIIWADGSIGAQPGMNFCGPG